MCVLVGRVRCEARVFFVDMRQSTLTYIMRKMENCNCEIDFLIVPSRYFWFD